MIKIILPGEPIAQARHRHFVRGGKAISYNPQHLEKDQTKWHVKEQYRGEALTTPLHAEISYYLPIPKSTPKKYLASMMSECQYHSKKPDLDNFLKFTFDALNGIVFKDDSQIASITARKVYSPNPRTEIELFSID